MLTSTVTGLLRQYRVEGHAQYDQMRRSWSKLQSQKSSSERSQLF
jgi:hypothetical protein